MGRRPRIGGRKWHDEANHFRQEEVRWRARGEQENDHHHYEKSACDIVTMMSPLRGEPSLTQITKQVDKCDTQTTSGQKKKKKKPHNDIITLNKWHWSRWPHNTITTLATNNKLLLNSIILTLIFCAAFHSQPRQAQAYQLTNNLIANNLPPKFVIGLTESSSSEMVVRVKEGSASIGKLIYTLKGDDPDDDPLTFGVLGSMASDLLRVENVPNNQANVYLRKELDRETAESHQVVITLTDGKLGRGNWVEDVNDNYPVFGPHRTAISLREDSRAPLVVETLEALDADEGRFGQVIYKLEEPSLASSASASSSSSSSSSVFAIETIDGRGVVSLVGALDYEQRSLYQLRITAVDRAAEHERLSATTSILISVDDCEDQPPLFTFAPAITRVPENLTPGSEVVRVHAIDGDRGVNNPIKYSIVSVNGHEFGHERNLFSINSDTGQLSVGAHALDREETLSTNNSDGGVTSRTTSGQPGAYVIQVRATELSAVTSTTPLIGLNSVNTELTIILTDVNDELPTFSSDKYYAELLENSAPDTLVSFFTTNNEATFASSLQSQSPQMQSGVAVKVFDRDQGTNGTFTLHVEGEHGHLFEVWPREATNEASVQLKVAPNVSGKYFDFERTRELHVRLIAREKYPPPPQVTTNNNNLGVEKLVNNARSSSAMVTIYLRDANDNYPQFESELYRVEVPENAQRGMHICAVHATDQDSGLFGTSGIRYTEIRGERANKFKLNPLTGVVTLSTNEHLFDRETIGQHHLIIEARDNNGIGNRNTTQLLIVLTDINDHAPKFVLDKYEALIYENELDFQSPLQVHANDNDAPNTQNSRISYSIVSGDPQQNFTIDPQSGRIRVRVPPLSLAGGENTFTTGQQNTLNSSAVMGLDFERIAQKHDDTRVFNLTVRATDAGAPEQLSDTTQVLVFVYDKNDHAPVFARPIYSKAIREDTPGGSAVVHVQAHDGDHSPSNSRITYRIASGASDKFVVDSDTGLVSVASGANLDIDASARRTNYLLTVFALDGSFGQSQKRASTLVNITIVDVNNKAPEFISLVNSNGGAAVNLSLTQLASNTKQQQQQQQQASVTVNEDAPYGLIVSRVLAHDLDSNAELRYSLNYARSEARNDDTMLVDPLVYRDVFTIDSLDGTIKVAKQLDRELFDQVKLRVQVEDIAAQTPDQMAYAYLLINIADTNDNRPTFKRPLYKAVVNENSISGTSVCTITADDRDLNKTLKYSLEGAPDVLRLVRVNPRSGEITVNDKIDRELYPLLNITIRAEDFGRPHSLSGSAQLLISVRDENDNNPVFLNTTLAPMRRNGDQNNNNNNNNNLSHQPIDHAQPKNHLNHLNQQYRLRSLTLPASAPTPETDVPTTTTLSTAPRQLDENGHELELLAPGATTRVREDAQAGEQLAFVRADDADAGNNGRVTYLLDAHSAAGKFRIDRDTGVLSVAGPLDREQRRHYALLIEACDNFDLGYSTGESRRAFMQVNVLVTDINDHAPLISTNLVPQAPHQHKHATATQANQRQLHNHQHQFEPSYDEALASQGPYEMALPECLLINEFQPLGEPILTITALDLDDPDTPNGQIDLAIINNSPQNELFALVVAPPQNNNVEPPKHGDDHTTSKPSSHDNEPVSLLSAVEAATSDAPASSSAAPDLSGFGDSLLLESAESADQAIVTPMSLRRARRAADSSTTGNVYKAAAARSPAPSGVGEQQAHVVVSQSLREKVGNYSLLVRATDRGQPSLFSVRAINICVQDVNNHAPVFIKPALNHTIRIMENATIGSFVVQVQASDADHGLNGEVHYSLKSSSVTSGSGSSSGDWQAFKIDRTSGIITTTRLFDRQLKKHYTLRVQAHDFGRPTSLSSDMDINVMIVNAGKYQPEFEQQMQSLQFTENQAPGREWFVLLQTTNLDDDPSLINLNNMHHTSTSTAANNNNEQALQQQNWLASPCYYIVDGDDHEQAFQLDRYSHKLTNRKELDREQQASYTLIVRASNNCNQAPGPLSSAATVDEVVHISTTESSVAVPEITDTQLIRKARSTPADQLKLQAQESLRRGKLTVVEKLSTGEPPRHLSQAASVQQHNYDALVASDKSLLKVSIKIKDLNDNAPKFTQRIYTGGITTEADFGTTFMIAQAIDLDADTNGQISYSIVKPIKRSVSLNQMSSSPSESLQALGDQEHQKVPVVVDKEPIVVRHKRTVPPPKIKVSSNEQLTRTTLETTTTPSDLDNEAIIPHGSIQDTDDLFVINAATGEISLNFDPQTHMKGYFEFNIIARDLDGLSDTAKVFIYLLRQDQRVKFVLRLTPQELRAQLNKFRSVMGNITGAIVNIDSYKYYENHDGTVDKKKTSLYLHFVRQDDNTIIEVDKVLTLIDNNIEYLDELYKEFHVLSSEAAHLPLHSGALVDPIVDFQVRTGLVGVSTFLMLILVLVLALCLNQRTRYERQLKAATVSAFGSSPLHGLGVGDFHSQTNLPNTNLHSQDPNPIWINGHHYRDHITQAQVEGGRHRVAHDHAADWLTTLDNNNQTTSNNERRDEGGDASSGKRAPFAHNLKRPNARLTHTLATVVTDCDQNRREVSSKKVAPISETQANKVFHSASSGVGMTLDDDDDDDELEHLSSGSDLSADARSVGHQLHYNVATATATPRDSLTSSSGQSPSSSGSNSASTTNERQALCSPTSNTQTLAAASNATKAQQSFRHQPVRNAKTPNGNRQLLANSLMNSSMGGKTIRTNNSTFGAFKEVTIYTQHHQQQHKSPQNNSDNVTEQNRIKPVATQSHQQPQLTSHVNKLATHFDQADKQNVPSQRQRDVHANKQATHQQGSRIVIHSNGADVNQGIIKQTQTKLNAKFVPPTSQQEQQEQNVVNFETSLSKLSILNLETTEL